MSEASVYGLRLADDALILSQQLCWWSSRAPELEEDLALTNIALDLLGQARILLSAFGDEDELAYLRTEREFTNLLIVEQPNGDFAQTIVRQLLFSTFQLARYEGLLDHADEAIAGTAAKGVKEVAYHRDHAVHWLVRLGDGTAESHARAQAALERLWPFTHEMLASDPLEAEFAIDPASLRERWEREVGEALTAATLSRPEDGDWRPHGGREGLHGEDFGFLLAEMQSEHRAHPGAAW
ncbi:MAG TPA: 1,2-phenylacetyl-CoA epoxidase subunit PaaC [Solirubrobacterales bacterium]|nr:1,2-phenylacetyl-CoA epoxidase subunit PaaC [Solirubrobacterales bacterium]